jgi:dTDP-glucose 4,6-dehydratase
MYLYDERTEQMFTATTLATTLVTGGCGAIGSEVINRLKALHLDIQFVNLDLLTYAGKQENIEQPFDNYIFENGDIRDPEKVKEVLQKYKPKYIIHLAAETHVDNSFGNSFVFTSTNVYGTHVLLECVREYVSLGGGLEKFVHMSTDEVYGSVGDDEEAKYENSLFAPSNPYAATKAAAEMLCHAYLKSWGIPIVIARCNNAISKYQNEEKLIPKIIACMLKGEKIPVHGKGQSKRVFIHAFDIADALWTMIEKGIVGDIYNIGTSMEYSVMEVIRCILHIMGYGGGELENHIEYVPDRVFQDYRYFIDSSALRQLGWSEKIGFEEAVKNVLEKYNG